jgi:hypothetical protein
MLSKKEVLRLVTALARMNDSGVISNDKGLPDEICAPADRKTVREIRALVVPLRQDLEYSESPEFRQAVGGKSPAFAEMQKRLSADPARRKAYADRIDKALEEVLDNDDAFRLLPESRHAALLMIRQHVASLRNPD